jgi:hypothetical protein
MSTTADTTTAGHLQADLVLRDEAVMRSRRSSANSGTVAKMDGWAAVSALHAAAARAARVVVGHGGGAYGAAAVADRAAYADCEAAVYAAAYTACVRFQAGIWSAANRPTHAAVVRAARVVTDHGGYGDVAREAAARAERHDAAVCEAAAHAAAYAARAVGATAGWTPAHATPRAARDAAVRGFWGRVDPAGLIRSLCEIR